MIRLDHITITVSNYVASLDWYASNFGLRVSLKT
jgi:catechol 2,3-dioxygenase-like lactoylglutathione lyase family enzyme